MTSLDEQQQPDLARPSALKSLIPIALAGMFMVTGILVLVYLGRDTARLLNAPLDDIELVPLVDADHVPPMSEMKGQIIVMHFWGTWCPPCREEFPQYVQLFNAYKGQPKVKFLTVSCSPGPEDNLDKLKEETIQFMHARELRIPNYADPAMYTRGRIAKMLSSGGFQYPMTLIVDNKGIVREFWLGQLSDTMKQVDEAVKIQLAEYNQQ